MRITHGKHLPKQQLTDHWVLQSSPNNPLNEPPHPNFIPPVWGFPVGWAQRKSESGGSLLSVSTVWLERSQHKRSELPGIQELTADSPGRMPPTGAWPGILGL